MDRLEIVSFLKNNVALFEGFTNTELETIVDGSKIVTFEQSEAVIEFGREVSFLGVLLQGQVQESCILDNGDTEILASVQAPDIFGETSVLTGESSTADVIGETSCLALLIPSAICSSLIVSKPSALQQLAKRLTNKTSPNKQHSQIAPQKSGSGNNSDPYGFTLHSDVPHKLLVINCGSSSLKYQLFDTDHPGNKVQGLVERIGKNESRHTFIHHTLTTKEPKFRQQETVQCKDHEAALELMATTLRAHKIILFETDITAVGHRVVHGGETFTSAAIIDDTVVEKISQLSPLAPLHNPINLLGIAAARKLFSEAVHVASFDTTFHHTLPPYAYLYGLPYKYYRDHGVRRYGFHGASHKYVSLKTAQFLRRPYNDLETIVCHLGSGASLCAVDHGRSVDTSMGFTPTAGVPMGTRSGDIDAGALCYLSRLENMDVDAMDTMINKESGLVGISEHSNDMRELESRAKEGHLNSQLAIKTFCYQVRKYIGAYVAAMQGLDALVFTGGVGENSTLVRALVCQGLSCMGIRVDSEKNRNVKTAFNNNDGEAVDISEDGSSVRVLVVPTNEELMIARNTLGAIERNAAAQPSKQEPIPVPIEVSAHHIHLCQADVEGLFGAGHVLTPRSELSQPGQFACEERVNLIGPKGTVERVRVLGPTRSKTQVEISMTEQFKLGVHPPIRQSGHVADTPGVTLEGPAGTVALKEGVICAMRHIHMTPADAQAFGVRDKYIVRVVVDGDRELVFGDVLVRVNAAYKLAMHIDTDEANAAHLQTGITGRIESIQSRG